MCRNSTRLPSIPMVDVLFCLIFAPVVQVRADPKRLYFQKVICDEGEMILTLSHILTHQDLEIIQKIRTMMNETLCKEDNIKQAHLAQVDFYIKRLLYFKRLPVDLYEKLIDLREEEEMIEKERKSKSKSIDDMIDESTNFFLQNDKVDTQLKQGEGFDEFDNELDENSEQMLTME